MKICTKCNLEKEDIDFAKRYNKLQSYCKECNNINNRKHYHENKAHRLAYGAKNRWKFRARSLKFIMEYAKNGCSQCDEKDFACIEFDHLDPSTKKSAISKMVSKGCELEQIKKELEKCRILCANCHKKHTAKQLNWYVNVMKHF